MQIEAISEDIGMKHPLIIVLAIALVSLNGCSDDQPTDAGESHHIWEHQVNVLRQAEAVAGQVGTQQSEQEETLRSLRDQQ
ncbi:MAG: hypothetical protein AMJ69_02295 [Gammaproteobacteria bacterium SG8_47]|nr:MAG: hypothetical protein AMJ69_02295 [Gammaproteobacteria bacterium SG8_47]